MSTNRGRRQVATEDREMTVSASDTEVTRDLQTVEPIYGRTEHGDVVEIPAGTIIRVAERTR